MKPKLFVVVHNSARTTCGWYETAENAELEAFSLAREHPGQDFSVCKVVIGVKAAVTVSRTSVPA